MSEIDYKPIFDYIDEAKAELRSEMATKHDVERILNAIDSTVLGSKNLNEKVVVVEAKAEQLEHWVVDASKKIDLPYQA